MKRWWLLKIAKVIVIAVVATIVLGFVVTWLWNGLIPDLFKGPEIGFWQAVGLLLLSHILLRGWGRWRYANGWHRDRWRHRLEEKLAAMTPEDREKFKQEWRHRCGWHHEGEGEKKEETGS